MEKTPPVVELFGRREPNQYSQGEAKLRVETSLIEMYIQDHKADSEQVSTLLPRLSAIKNEGLGDDFLSKGGSSHYSDSGYGSGPGPNNVSGCSCCGLVLYTLSSLMDHQEKTHAHSQLRRNTAMEKCTSDVASCSASVGTGSRLNAKFLQALDLIKINSKNAENSSSSVASLDTDNIKDEMSVGSVPDSPQRSQELVVIRAKHQLLVTLMKEVYAIFDPSWDPDTKKCAGSNQGSQGGSNDTPGNPGSTEYGKLGKRPSRDDETPPGGNENDKRRRLPSAKQLAVDKNRLFACPFNKYDAEKFHPAAASGFRYRSCVGPGFKSISHTKQHLQRVHQFIQCQRCWSIMKTSDELTAHLNEDVRCEKQSPQFDSISQSKMDHIMSKWGASWEDIYEILFPGAQIPSPLFEPLKSLMMQKHQEQHFLETSEILKRITADLAPVEEKLKALFGDTLRTCQSILHENYKRLNGRSAGDTGIGKTMAGVPNILPYDDLCFQEPSFTNTELNPSPSQMRIHTENKGDQSKGSDSGYGSGNADLSKIDDKITTKEPSPFDSVTTMRLPEPLPGFAKWPSFDFGKFLENHIDPLSMESNFETSSHPPDFSMDELFALELEE